MDLLTHQEGHLQERARSTREGMRERGVAVGLASTEVFGGW